MIDNSTVKWRMISDNMSTSVEHTEVGIDGAKESTNVPLTEDTVLYSRVVDLCNLRNCAVFVQRVNTNLLIQSYQQTKKYHSPTVLLIKINRR